MTYCVDCGAPQLMERVRCELCAALEHGGMVYVLFSGNGRPAFWDREEAVLQEFGPLERMTVKRLWAMVMEGREWAL